MSDNESSHPGAGKDKWDKLAILLHPVGGLLTAVAVASLRLLGSRAPRGGGLAGRGRGGEPRPHPLPRARPAAEHRSPAPALLRADEPAGRIRVEPDRKSTRLNL